MTTESSSNKTFSQKPLILLADTFIPERDKLRKQLLDLGCRVEEAASNVSVLHMLLADDFDLAVLDRTILQACDNFNLLDKVRQIRPWVQIVLTDHNNEDHPPPEIQSSFFNDTSCIINPTFNSELLKRLLAKRRNMLEPRNRDTLSSAVERLGNLFQHAQSSLEENGLTSFLDGVGPGIGNLIPSELTAILDTTKEEASLKLITKHPVSESFIKKTTEEILSLYKALSKNELYTDSIATSLVNGKPTDDGFHTPGDIFTFPIIIQNHLEGLLTLAATDTEEYCRRSVPFLYQAANQLPQILPALKKMRHMAICDSFTGLYNRSYCEKILAKLWEEGVEDDKEFALLMIDVDKFKRINDYYGHAVGDDILLEFSQLVLATSRKSDTVVRYGGDELVIFLPNANKTQAEACGKRVLQAVREHLFCQDKVPLHLTISIGVSTNQMEGMQGDEDVMMFADKAMYRAKELGGDKVCTAWQLPVKPQARLKNKKTVEKVKTEVIDEVHTEPINKGNLLVVDDEQALCKIFDRHLTKKGYQVITANKGREALKRLSSNPESVDVLLSDLQMPEMNGNQLLSEFKKIAPLAEAIIVTGYSSEDNVLAAMRGGAYDFIRKPVDFDELEFTIDRAVEHRRLKVELEDYRLRLEEKLAQKTASLENAYLSTMEALSTVISVRESNTAAHNKRVSTFSVFLATKLGITGPRLETINKAALLHDIGKIGIPDKVLLKPGLLTSDEREVIEQHAVIGYNILKDIPFLKEEAELVHSHHERWDGTGYPKGLKGENICLESRIFAVADAFDALRSDRVYRKGLPLKDCVQEIRDSCGTHFDPKVVEVFLQHSEEMEKMFPYPDHAEQAKIIPPLNIDI